MYLDEEGNVVKGKSTTGSLAIGVPGTIAGIFKAQGKFGNLAVETIIQPVIELGLLVIIIIKLASKTNGLTVKSLF